MDGSQWRCARTHRNPASRAGGPCRTRGNAHACEAAFGEIRTVGHQRVVPRALSRGVAMILMSHPTGNANVRQAALALKESNQLAEFWTCLAPDPDSIWMRLLPRSLGVQFQRRALP